MEFPLRSISGQPHGRRGLARDGPAKMKPTDESEVPFQAKRRPAIGQPDARTDEAPTPTPNELKERLDAAGEMIPRIHLTSSGDRIPIQREPMVKIPIAGSNAKRLPPPPVTPQNEAGTSPTVGWPPPIQPAAGVPPTGAPSTPPPPPTGQVTGQTVGPYAIVQELAKGGMGSVYLAEDHALRRRVAIKMMAKDLITDQDAVRRFEREARATATIIHPNIALIYLVGLAEDGAPFLAMEYVGGGTLERTIRDRVRLPFSKVADIMIQSCEALRAAQRQGIIHRDVKPANIMLTVDGVVKVVDFGLAKFFNEDSFRTLAGAVMGTPRYMSPEQTQGREVDYRSDIYSIGACFYHVLAGRAVFEADSPTQIMMKHVTAPVVPMRSINPDVPMEFDEVIRKCLAKDPNERYQDYSDLISDLSRIKLQWTARERGSLVMSHNDFPTIRLKPDGTPMPPSSQISGSGTWARGPVAKELEPPTEVHEVPVWRWVLIGGGVFVLVAILAMSLFMPRKEEPKPVAQGPKSGLRLLIDRLTQQQTTGQSTTDPMSRPHPNYVRYLATKRIVQDLSGALLYYKASNGGADAPDLAVVVKSGSIRNIEFDMDSGGTPLDAWSVRLDYSPYHQTVKSAGVDKSFNTADDIIVDVDGAITIEDMAVYEKLEEDEEKRRLGGNQNRTSN